MKQVEAIWIERRTDRSGDISVYQWLDYQGKLTNQHLKPVYYLAPSD